MSVLWCEVHDLWTLDRLLGPLKGRGGELCTSPITALRHSLICLEYIIRLTSLDVLLHLKSIPSSQPLDLNLQNQTSGKVRDPVSRSRFATHNPMTSSPFSLSLSSSLELTPMNTRFCEASVPLRYRRDSGQHGVKSFVI